MEGTKLYCYSVDINLLFDDVGVNRKINIIWNERAYSKLFMVYNC